MSEDIFERVNRRQIMEEDLAKPQGEKQEGLRLPDIDIEVADYEVVGFAHADTKDELCFRYVPRERLGRAERRENEHCLEMDRVEKKLLLTEVRLEKAEAALRVAREALNSARKIVEAGTWMEGPIWESYAAALAAASPVVKE